MHVSICPVNKHLPFRASKSTVLVDTFTRVRMRSVHEHMQVTQCLWFVCELILPPVPSSSSSPPSFLTPFTPLSALAPLARLNSGSPLAGGFAQSAWSGASPTCAWS